MDVRCEKCQTEYELDESRLKPGGVTVKCTNCGHMFKIRKRKPTNVGLAQGGGPAPEERTRPASSRPPMSQAQARADSILDEAPTVRAASDAGSGPTEVRQWLIRLETGETKSCRELATLQQWIVAGIVTRESLISRSGKTWKRLGDIAELGQYFVIADEGRAKRARQATPKPLPAVGAVASTMLGYTGGARGGNVGVPGAPIDEDEQRTTGNFRSRPSTSPPPPPKVGTQPGQGSHSGSGARANPMAQTELAPSFTEPPTTRRPPTQPPPIPAGRQDAQPRSSISQPPPGNRNTAAWASGDVKASDSMVAMPQGPRGGKLSAIPDEPAFAGRVRVSPTDEASFDTGKVRAVDDDDDMLPGRTGSRAGMWIVLLALVTIGCAAAATYMFVFRPRQQAAKAPADAPRVAVVPDAAAAPVVPVDAAAPPPPSPIEVARAELADGAEAKQRAALAALPTTDDALALRALLSTAIAQSELDRARLGADHAEADKLRSDAKQLVVDAAPLAQKAQKAAANDPLANLAFADVLRLQGKPARDVRRYLDAARPQIEHPAGKPAGDKDLAHDLAVIDALVSIRDGKLDDAQKTLGAVDGDDARVKLQLAMVALAQNRAQDAKPIIDTLLTAQPDHDAARALAHKLETSVAKTDPLPPENPAPHPAPLPGQPPPHANPNPNPAPSDTGDSYDALVARAGKLAESNCSKAMELYGKALEKKPNGVEALSGMGYCHIDAKQYSSAYSNFRAALAVAPRYEPALSGIAEAYMQQGRKQDAIDSWRKVLDAFPDSAKAKKQLEALGAGPDSGSAAPAPAPPAPAPTPPAPAPSPAPEAAGGAGSGSA